MKYLVTGANGALGHAVAYELMKRGNECVCSDLGDEFKTDTKSGTECRNIFKAAALPRHMSYVRLDITDTSAVLNTVLELEPDVVIHCAAWTNVDDAEDPDKQKKVRLINTQGTRNIAIACENAGCKLVYISTDYVFGGEGEEPWSPDCKAFSPLNFYGLTKLEGEIAVSTYVEKFFIVRTSWVFGKYGPNFINTMINVGKTHPKVRVVNDQIGTPTYTVDLARLLADMSETDKYGYYHASNEGGYVSWYDFCVEIYRQYGLDTEITPVSTSEYGSSKAKRPLNSRLDKSKLVSMGFEPLPDWKDALSRYLVSIREQ